MAEVRIRLEDIQQIYIKRFKEFHSFLETNNISYFAVGGTALGAFRHKGFIPWDNDMDIGMLRDDYERFVSISKNLSPDRFRIYSYKTKNRYVSHALTKVAILGTRQVINEFNSYDKCFHIDVFPFDKVPLSDKEKKKAATRRKIYHRLLYYKSRKKSSSFFKTCFLRVFQFLLLPITSKRIATSFDKYAKSFSDKFITSKNVVNFMGVYSFEREAVPLTVIGTPKKMTFNSIEIMVPEKCDEYLKNVYGDNFMKPADKRIDEKEYYCFVDDSLLVEIRNQTDE